MVSPNIEKTKKTTEAKVPPVIISSTAFSSVSSPFTIPNFTIEDEIIMLTTNFSGSSVSADFYLTTDGSIDNIDGESVIKLRLIRSVNNNVSKVNMEQELSFDLSPLHSFIPKSVYLDIEGIGMVNYSF